MKWEDDIRLALICLCVVGAWLSGFFIGREICKPGTQGEIIGKHEEAERCFVDLRIEIPANDYIGLDIGDEYETGGNK